MQIENRDNPPLKVDEIRGFQSAVHILSYFEGGQKYKFQMGHNKVEHPDYDLELFTDFALTGVQVAGHSSVVINPAFKEFLPQRRSNLKPWLWAAVVFAVALLSFLTLKMIREIKSEDGK
jgi:hypothetical protein